MPLSELALATMIAVIALVGHALTGDYATGCVAAGVSITTVLAAPVVGQARLGSASYGWGFLPVFLLCYGLSFAVAMVVGLPFRLARRWCRAPRDSEYTDGVGSWLALGVRVTALLLLVNVAVVGALLIHPSVMFAGFAVTAGFSLREVSKDRRRARRRRCDGGGMTTVPT